MNRAVKLFRLSQRALSDVFYEIFVPDLNPMSRKLRRIFANEKDKKLYLDTMKGIRNDVKNGKSIDEAKKTITLSNNEQITISL